MWKYFFLDPRQYLGQMIADGDLMGGGAGDDSTERDPDQMREKIRRESVNLISGSLAAHLQGSLAGSLPPTVNSTGTNGENLSTIWWPLIAFKHSCKPLF